MLQCSLPARRCRPEAARAHREAATPHRRPISGAVWRHTRRTAIFSRNEPSAAKRGSLAPPPATPPFHQFSPSKICFRRPCPRRHISGTSAGGTICRQSAESRVTRYRPVVCSGTAIALLDICLSNSQLKSPSPCGPGTDARRLPAAPPDRSSDRRVGPAEANYVAPLHTTLRQGTGPFRSSI